MSDTVYKIVTYRIVSKLEAGVAPWRMTWATIGQPQNLVSGRAYRGINALLTATSGFDSPYWLTYKQAVAKGGNVKKGEKGTPIIYLGDYESANEAGEVEKVKFLRYYTAFNLRQCEGIADPGEVVSRSHDHGTVEAASRIHTASPLASLKIKPGSPAYYPFADFITMPEIKSFETGAAYYATLFHEMGHATGHASRLNREAVNNPAKFGSHTYSKEELVAEMTAAFLCHEAGISNITLDNSASYLASWLKVLRADPKMLVQSAAAAQKATDYILNKKD